MPVVGLEFVCQFDQLTPHGWLALVSVLQAAVYLGQIWGYHVCMVQQPYAMVLFEKGSWLGCYDAHVKSQPPFTICLLHLYRVLSLVTIGCPCSLLAYAASCSPRSTHSATDKTLDHL
jgi:hypothetical protein